MLTLLPLHSRMNGSSRHLEHDPRRPPKRPRPDEGQSSGSKLEGQEDDRERPAAGVHPQEAVRPATVRIEQPPAAGGKPSLGAQDPLSHPDTGDDEENDEERLIRERRRRLDEILAKHRAPQQEQLLHAATPPQPAADVRLPPITVAAQPPAAEGPQGGGGDNDEPVAVRDVLDPQAEARRLEEKELRDYLLQRKAREEDGGGIDEGRTRKGAANGAPRSPGTGEGALAAVDGPEDAAGFDMFSDSPVMPMAKPAALPAAKQNRGDAADDVEGYFAHRPGDVLGGRYRVVATFGRGVFSTVVKCADLNKEEHHVAVKIIRNNDMMRRAGEKEAAILNKLQSGDAEDKQHVIRFHGTFTHEEHLCLTFESMHQNLRQALRQHGHRQGIQIDAVRTYARQLFTALRHLERTGIIHADLKPDNMVVNERYTTLKVCDLGSAMELDEVEVTPLLQSRFYRAPEVILGLHFNCAVDVWSAACTIFELYTGRFLFQVGARARRPGSRMRSTPPHHPSQGASNNAMLKLIQDVRGKVPGRLIRRGAFAGEHFDADSNFVFLDVDKVQRRGQPCDTG